MTSESRQEEVLHHLQSFWPKNRLQIFRWDSGPLLNVVDIFRVCRVTPASQEEPWIYVTLNASEAINTPSEDVEFMIMSPSEDMIHIETLAAFTFFGITYPIYVGKIVDIGREWFPNSRMHHFLVSRPYPYGPELEWGELGETKVRILWLLPITEEEVRFAEKYGIEQLEKKFDEKEINVLDLKRSSAI